MLSDAHLQILFSAAVITLDFFASLVFTQSSKHYFSTFFFSFIILLLWKLPVPIEKRRASGRGRPNSLGINSNFFLGRGLWCLACVAQTEQLNFSSSWCGLKHESIIGFPCVVMFCKLLSRRSSAWFSPKKSWLLASHYYFISITADMTIFIQSFSSLWVFDFLLVLAVISSSHAEEMCSSATDGRCVLNGCVVLCCLCFYLHRWSDVLSQTLHPKSKLDKRGLQFSLSSYFSP